MMTPDAPNNAPADCGVIVYNEDGTINREAFGRVLSRFERALCDALDNSNMKYAAVRDAFDEVAVKMNVEYSKMVLRRAGGRVDD